MLWMHCIWYCLPLQCNTDPQNCSHPSGWTWIKTRKRWAPGASVCITRAVQYSFHMVLHFAYTCWVAARTLENTRDKAHGPLCHSHVRRKAPTSVHGIHGHAIVFGGGMSANLLPATAPFLELTAETVANDGMKARGNLQTALSLSSESGMQPWTGCSNLVVCGWIRYSHTTHTDPRISAG